MQNAVADYWNAAPCDSTLSSEDKVSQSYFREIEQARYALQPHILEFIDRIDWRGKRVLEIGTGVGTDARQLIARGAIYTGVNVDRGSVEATAAALKAFALAGEVNVCDATRLAYPDASFDAVYSFGVLHHIPDVERAVDEIHRVLKPDGHLLVMLYNRESINYRIEIRFARKLGVRLLHVPGAIGLFSAAGFPREKLERHAALWRGAAMSDEEWLSRNTDGPDNPFSRVYGEDDGRELLSRFEVLANQARFFDARHWGLPGRLLPAAVVRGLGERWGWHRLIHARKATAAPAPDRRSLAA